MEIDLDQLPIPDWGLACPQCRYPLRGLPSHRCPECGTAFEVRELVRPWTRLRPPRFTGHELPMPDFGLNCPTCGAPLTGARQHVCAHCGRPFDPEAFRPRPPWFILDANLCGDLPIAGVQALLAEELVPHVPVDEKTIGEIVGGHDALHDRLRAPSEFYFEIRWLIRRAQGDMARVRSMPQADWGCAHCGQVNPGHFEVCWNCQRTRNDEGRL